MNVNNSSRPTNHRKENVYPRNKWNNHTIDRQI